MSYILQFIDRAKFYDELILNMQGITDADYVHRAEIKKIGECHNFVCSFLWNTLFLADVLEILCQYVS